MSKFLDSVFLRPAPEVPGFQAREEGQSSESSHMNGTPTSSTARGPPPSPTSSLPPDSHRHPQTHLDHNGGSLTSRSPSSSRPGESEENIVRQDSDISGMPATYLADYSGLHEVVSPDGVKPESNESSSHSRPRSSPSHKHIHRTKVSKYVNGPSRKPVNRQKNSHRLENRSHLNRFNPQVVLQNSGSVARDHLASERTFLAYVRTSLAIASMGVAIVQLFTIADLTSRGTGTPLSKASQHTQKFARPIGVTAVLLALVVLGIAVYRYFLVQNALPEKKFPVARFSIAFISFVLGAVVVVVFAALVNGIRS